MGTYDAWIGVDLDGTLAVEEEIWRGEEYIGEPIPEMVDRVKTWIAEGKNVKIFTARMDPRNRIGADNIRKLIEAWCLEHIGTVLPVTNMKEYGMIELWDDRAIQILKNTGKRADGQAE